MNKYKCSKLMQSIINNPKPIIAEVAGTATAAGCQLVASCDLAYAGKSSRFATPGAVSYTHLTLPTSDLV